jgi:VIT1/CCC1 family predicted Fe2+/Mn2+ transporter
VGRRPAALVDEEEDRLHVNAIPGTAAALAAAGHHYSHSPGWDDFFVALVLVVGAALALLGVHSGVSGWRGSGPPRARTLRGTLLGMGLLLVPGLAIAAVGVWLY